MHPDYPEIFIVQPAAFIPITRMVYALLQKRMEIEEEKKKYTFEEAEKIEADFQEMKRSLINVSLTRLKNNFDKVKDGLVTIRNMADDLLEGEMATIMSQIETVIRKVEGFKIRRIVEGVKKLADANPHPDSNFVGIRENKA